jgi:hypothetical protein
MDKEPSPLTELGTLLTKGGRWWMVPIIIAAVVLVVGMLFMHAVQYVAPFVYVSPT